MQSNLTVGRATEVCHQSSASPCEWERLRMTYDLSGKGCDKNLYLEGEISCLNMYK